MDSAKNVERIIPFKKFGMVRVNTILTKLGVTLSGVDDFL